MPLILDQKQLDEFNTIVTELRGYHEKMKGGVLSSGEFQEREEKMNTELKAIMDRVDQLETKMNRPLVGNDKSPKPEVKAFCSWMRKGIAGPDEVKLLATDDDSTGGYMVPTVLMNRIIETIVDISPVRQDAAVETISGNLAQMPKEDGTFASGWVAERGTRAVTGNQTFTLEQIPLHEMYAEPQATQTMLDDAAFNVEAWIERKLVKRFAATEGTAFVSGSGVGQPEGFMTPATVGYVDSGDANLIPDGDCIVKLLYELHEDYVPGAKLYMRRATELSLMLLKDGNGNYIWQPSYQAGTPSAIRGVAIKHLPDMPAIAANAYPIAYANLGEAYQIIDKAGVGMIRDNLTVKGSVLFYTTRRVGGQLVNQNAIKKLRIHA